MNALLSINARRFPITALAVALFVLAGEVRAGDAPVGTSNITPAAGADPARAVAPALDDGELEHAIAEARAARAAGKLKPAATTPEQFARALGAINYRIVAFGLRHPEPPEPGTAVRKTYDGEMAQLTADLANLLSDEDLAEKSPEDSPEKLAHHQAWLAAGALDLDEAATGKVEAILAKGYAAAMPVNAGDPLTPEQDAELEKNLEAMTENVAKEIAALLTPAQMARLNALGIEQVLFGLPAIEE